MSSGISFPSARRTSASEASLHLHRQKDSISAASFQQHSHHQQHLRNPTINSRNSNRKRPRPFHLLSFLSPPHLKRRRLLSPIPSQKLEYPKNMALFPASSSASSASGSASFCGGSGAEVERQQQQQHHLGNNCWNDTRDALNRGTSGDSRVPLAVLSSREASTAPHHHQHSLQGAGGNHDGNHFPSRGAQQNHHLDTSLQFSPSSFRRTSTGNGNGTINNNAPFGSPNVMHSSLRTTVPGASLMNRMSSPVAVAHQQASMSAHNSNLQHASFPHLHAPHSPRSQLNHTVMDTPMAAPFGNSTLNASFGSLQGAAAQHSLISHKKNIPTTSSGNSLGLESRLSAFLSPSHKRSVSSSSSSSLIYPHHNRLAPLHQSKSFGQQITVEEDPSNKENAYQKALRKTLGFVFGTTKKSAQDVSSHQTAKPSVEARSRKTPCQSRKEKKKSNRRKKHLKRKMECRSPSSQQVSGKTKRIHLIRML